MKTRSPAENPAFEAALADELDIALNLTCGDDLRTFAFGL
jgi:hypothetical protein